MKLPNRDQATVSPDKVRSYLLSPQHPTGRFKARFFRGLGYSDDNWETLCADLLRLAQEGEAEPMPSPFGEKYRILGLVEGPNGRSAELVTIWIVNRGESEPRFVTAYPGE